MAVIIGHNGLDIRTSLTGKCDELLTQRTLLLYLDNFNLDWHCRSINLHKFTLAECIECVCDNTEEMWDQADASSRVEFTRR